MLEPHQIHVLRVISFMSNALKTDVGFSFFFFFEAFCLAQHFFSFTVASSLSLTSFLTKKHHVFASSFPLLAFLCADLVGNNGIVQLQCFTQLHLLNICTEASIHMPYHRAECGTCLVHLVRILSITLWLWFKTVNTLFLLVVFIFIIIFIFAVRCHFLMAAVFISAVELLGGEEPQCLNVLVRSYLFFFCDVLRRRPRHLKVCVQQYICYEV